MGYFQNITCHWCVFQNQIRSDDEEDDEEGEEEREVEEEDEDEDAQVKKVRLL